MKLVEYKDLPKLTDKQRKAVERFLLDGDKSAAYRHAYNTKKMKPESINRVAFRLFDQVKMRSWVEYHQDKAAIEFDVTFEEQLKNLSKATDIGLRMRKNIKGKTTIIPVDLKGSVSAMTEINRMKGFHAPINANIGLTTDKIENENADSAIIDKLLTAIATKSKRKVRKKPKP